MYKICFISTVHQTLLGFIVPLAEHLHQTGDSDISFICSPDESFANSLPEYIHFYPIKMRRGINLDGIRCIREIKDIFETEQFSLVQYSTPNASCYASIAAKAAKIPVRLYCQWGLVFEGFSGIKREIFKLIEKMVCKKSTWIEPDSYGNLEYCRKLGFYTEQNSSVVLYGSAKGVDLTVFDAEKREAYRKELREKHQIPENVFVFGFAGSLTGDKGTNELLEAFKAVHELHNQTRLLLVGDMEKEQSLNRELLDWAQKSDAVIFTGLSKTVQKEMSAMDCYVMPSYREGFGLTVVEAGAMCLPVICTNIPGPTDAIEDGVNGLLIEKKNAAQLKQAMLRLYGDRELCKQLGKAGLRIVRERYEQKKLFQAIVEDRKRLLGINKTTAKN